MRRLKLTTAALALVTASAGPAWAEEQKLEFTLVTHPIESAAFDTAGGTNMSARKSIGVAYFKDGRVAFKQFVYLIEARDGFRAGDYNGYSTYTFENGDAITAKFTGGWGGDKNGGEYEVISGKGAYEGVTGTGSWTGREDAWQDAYLADGQFTLEVPAN